MKSRELGHFYINLFSLLLKYFFCDGSQLKMLSEILRTEQGP
jgi:hypothetical protein